MRLVMSDRRRTYWNGDDNDMSRFIIADNMDNSYYKYSAVLYDMKLGVGKAIEETNTNNTMHYSQVMTTYNGVVYVAGSICGSGLGDYSWLSSAPTVGKNIVTYIEDNTDSSYLYNIRTLVMTAEDGIIGKSYNTLVDSETGQLYAFCMSGSSSNSKFHIMKLDSSYNITSVNSLSSANYHDFDSIRYIKNEIAYGISMYSSDYTYPGSIYSIDLESTTYSITKLVGSLSNTSPNNTQSTYGTL